MTTLETSRRKKLREKHLEQSIPKKVEALPDKKKKV